MKLLRSKTFWILIAAGLITAAVFAYRSLGPKIPVAAAARREIAQKVVVSGRVLPPARINVGSLMAGVINKVAVKEGDHVKAGDLLLQIDDADARAGLVQAQAGLAQARARVQQLHEVAAPVAREAHHQADANLELAQLTYQRQSVLVNSGAVPPSQLDDAKRALDVAKSQHDASEAQSFGTGSRGADHALALAAQAQAAASVAIAKVRLAQSRITAATDAIVLTRSAEPGDIVQPGRVLLVLARDGDRLLVVQPDEKTLADLKLGQKARAAADAFPNAPFDAEVSYIAPSIDPQRGTVEVRLTAPSPPPHILPDMTVSVDIEVGRRPDALVVPSEAVHDVGTPKPWVWLVRAGRVERREITLGLRGVGAMEVAAGLEDGDIVAMPSSATLVNGQRVRPQAAR